MIYEYFSAFFTVLLGDLMQDTFLSFIVHQFINIVSILIVVSIISLPFVFFLKLLSWRKKR